MNNIHPSEKEIQQFALDKSNSDSDVIAHINSCPDCKTEVSVYQLLFSEIKEQQSPVFDFDLQELVLSKLPKTRRRLSTDDIIAGFLIIFTCACITVPLFIFRKMILITFIDIPPFFIYSIISSTSFILIIKILSLYKKHLKQMYFLNFN